MAVHTFLLTVLAVCASAEYLFEEDAVELVGGQVASCLQDLPAVILGQPFNPLEPVGPAPPAPRGARGVLVLHPGSAVCMRQLMEVLWEEGILEEARDTVVSCLFDHYPAAFETGSVVDSSSAPPAARAVLQGLECAVSALERGLSLGDIHN